MTRQTCFPVALASVTALLSATLSGCTEDYVLRGDHLAQLRTEQARGVPAERLAISAQDGADRQRFLRASYLPELPPVSSPQTLVTINHTDSRAKRITGTTLFALGLAHLVALAGHLGATAAAAASCSKDPYCINEDWSPVISGPILGTAGLSLAIPGIVLMVSGYSHPRDAQPGQPDLLYVK
jgi:hypothetical protein